MTRSGEPPSSLDVYYIFRTWRTNPVTKEREYAKDHGLKAWRIPVQRNRTKTP